MKVYEFLLENRDTLSKMELERISVNDAKYLPMYERFLEMKNQGDKVLFIAEKLSREYGIKLRRFYYLVRKFERVLP